MYEEINKTHGTLKFTIEHKSPNTPMSQIVKNVIVKETRPTDLVMPDQFG